MRLRQQILAQNACYIAGRTIKPKGVMVHSTGANNPNVSRYVPGDAEMGCSGSPRWNTYHAGGADIAPHNFILDSNTRHCKYCGGDQKCVHAFIGRFADGKVGVVQTLPWNHRGWHGGGDSNNTHIGFEICEDGLTDPVYFKAVYQEAVELTAYLCKEFSLDPLKDGVVICHQEGYRRGIASNHGDVLHWFPKRGKSMDDFRRDVAEAMKPKIEEDNEMLSYEQWKVYMERYRKELGALPVPEWAVTTGEWDKAFADGIIADKTRPQDLATRAEVAGMIERAVK